LVGLRQGVSARFEEDLDLSRNTRVVQKKEFEYNLQNSIEKRR
jgi:hypothetical protein